MLATVACGLYVSWNGPRLIPSATRLQGIFFWDLIVYLIEGLVFLLTGLQARTLHRAGACLLDPRTADRDRVDDADRDRGAFHLGVSGNLYSALAEPALAQARSIAALARAVLSLVHRRTRRGVARRRAGHSLHHRSTAQPFPHRDLILFVTFGVIIITLVGQGLMLPSVVRWLGLSRLGKKEHKDEIRAELRARQAALRQVEKRLEKAIKEHDLPDEAIAHLRTRNQSRLQILPDEPDRGSRAHASDRQDQRPN